MTVVVDGLRSLHFFQLSCSGTILLRLIQISFFVCCFWTFQSPATAGAFVLLERRVKHNSPLARTSPYTAAGRTVVVKQQRRQNDGNDGVVVGLLNSIRNLRPICDIENVDHQSNKALFYRSASLDELSIEESQQWMAMNPQSPSRIATIIDLRNADEIARGQRNATVGSRLLYEWMRQNENSNLELSVTKYHHVPILQDLDAFWNQVASELPSSTRLKATLQLLWDGSALDRVAARHLEQAGLPGLYRAMLVSGAPLFRTALDTCLERASAGPILIHCQKGKDRTGLLSMLLQHILVSDDEETASTFDKDKWLISSYAQSEQLLGERQEIQVGDDNGNNAFVNWNYFRGSPPSAMRETLQWIHATYGNQDSTSVALNAYLDFIGFDAKRRQALRRACKTNSTRTTKTVVAADRNSRESSIS